MDIHVRNLGVLSIAFGLVSVIGAIGILWYFGSVSVLFNFAEDRGGLGFITVALVLSHLIVGIPFVTAGRFVMEYRNWARSVLMALCGLSVLLIPFGSIISIYGFWVLMTPETEPLFSDRPTRSLRNRRGG